MAVGVALDDCAQDRGDGAGFACAGGPDDAEMLAEQIVD